MTPAIRTGTYLDWALAHGFGQVDSVGLPRGTITTITYERGVKDDFDRWLASIEPKVTWVKEETPVVDLLKALHKPNPIVLAKLPLGDERKSNIHIPKISDYIRRLSAQQEVPAFVFYGSHGLGPRALKFFASTRLFFRGSSKGPLTEFEENWVQIRNYKRREAHVYIQKTMTSDQRGMVFPLATFEGKLPPQDLQKWPKWAEFQVDPHAWSNTG